MRCCAVPYRAMLCARGRGRDLPSACRFGMGQGDLVPFKVSVDLSVRMLSVGSFSCPRRAVLWLGSSCSSSRCRSETQGEGEDGSNTNPGAGRGLVAAMGIGCCPRPFLPGLVALPGQHLQPPEYGGKRSVEVMGCGYWMSGVPARKGNWSRCWDTCCSHRVRWGTATSHAGGRGFSVFLLPMGRLHWMPSAPGRAHGAAVHASVGCTHLRSMVEKANDSLHPAGDF